MKYEVEKQVDEINDAIAIFGLVGDESMIPPTEEEMAFAIKKATSCMTLMVRLLCHKDMTMRDLNEEIRRERNCV